VVAGLVSSGGILAIFDPVFYLSPSFADLDSMIGLKPGVGYDESHAEKELFRMPLQLAHHPSGLVPGLCLILQFDNLHLSFILGRTTGLALEMGPDECFQDIFNRDPDKEVMRFCSQN